MRNFINTLLGLLILSPILYMFLAPVFAKDKTVEQPTRTHAKTTPIIKEELLHAWRTKKFLIKIYKIGDDNYRYKSWGSEKNFNDLPDLVLENGKLIFEGSGGNHNFTFTNKEYKYVCSVTILGESVSDIGYLKVSKNNQQLFLDRVVEDMKDKNKIVINKKTNKAIPEVALKQMADYYKTKLPFQIDDYTTMTNVHVKNRDIVMIYTIQGMTNKSAKKAIQEQNIRELQKICNSKSGRLILYKDKSSMVHMYYDMNKNLIETSTIDRKNCERLRN